MLRDDFNHPRANDYYCRIQVGKVKKLPCLVRNIIPRRISFGFTTLNRLLKARSILQLYNIAPTEKSVEDGLKQAGIKAIAQHYVSIGKKPRSRACGTLRGRRYCLDFAIFCRKGAIAIECDNKKAHSAAQQRERDKIKNVNLRRAGWTVIRLAEQDIISDLPGCIARVKKAMRQLGGIG